MATLLTQIGGGGCSTHADRGGAALLTQIGADVIVGRLGEQLLTAPAAQVIQTDLLVHIEERQQQQQQHDGHGAQEHSRLGRHWNRERGRVSHRGAGHTCRLS